MPSVLDALAFDAEIINDQAKHDGTPNMFVEARCVLAFIVARLNETFFQELVG